MGAQSRSTAGNDPPRAGTAKLYPKTQMQLSNYVLKAQAGHFVRCFMAWELDAKFRSAMAEIRSSCTPLFVANTEICSQVPVGHLTAHRRWCSRRGDIQRRFVQTGHFPYADSREDNSRRQSIRARSRRAGTDQAGRGTTIFAVFIKLNDF